MIPQDLLGTNRNPTDEERQYVTKLAEDIDAQIKELELKKASLLETSMKFRQVLAPIRKLPREIIEKILKACVEDVEWPCFDHNIAPILLTHISSNLRHIALNCPSLWSKIDFVLSVPRSQSKANTKQRIKMKIRAVEEWIRRSGSEPLTFKIEFPHWRPRHLFEVLRKCSSRWKDVSLIFDYNFSAEIFSIAVDHFPLLTALHIVCNIIDQHGIASSYMLKAPNLRKLGIDGTINPIDYHVDWSRLTHLNMDVCHVLDYDTASQDLATILRQATSLVDLVLKTWYTNDEELDEILLPNLKALLIIEFADLDRPDKTTIIPFMRAPLLESLDTDTIFDEIEGFLEQCPRLRKLTIRCLPEQLKTISTWLQHLPLLEELQMFRAPNIDFATSELPKELLLERNGAVLCPNLHKLGCDIVIQVPFQALAHFLRLAQTGSAPRKNWAVDLTVWITNWSMETRQLLDELLEEQANYGVGVILYVQLPFSNGQVQIKRNKLPT